MPQSKTGTAGNPRSASSIGSIQVLVNLNNREIAVVVWTALVLLWVLSKRDIRRSLLGVLRAFLVPKLIGLWLSLGAYTILLVGLLERIGLWHLGLLKETVVWLAFTGIAYLFQFGGLNKDRPIASTIARDSLSALILVEFLVDSYPFPLLIELILLPLITFIVMIGALAESKEEFRPAARAMVGLQALIGFTLVAFAIRSAFSDPVPERRSSGSGSDSARPFVGRDNPLRSSSSRSIYL